VEILIVVARRDTKMRMKVCWGVLGVLVGLFVLIVTPLGRLIHLDGDFKSFVVPLGILGAALIVMVAVTRMNVVLKSFLGATGTAAIGWPVSLYLHSTLIRFFPTEPFTYILFFFIFTPVFIIGAAGTVIIGIRQLVSLH
jgi:hypothetical protein